MADDKVEFADDRSHCLRAQRCRGSSKFGILSRAKGKFAIKANEQQPNSRRFIGACAQVPGIAPTRSNAPARRLSMSVVR